MSGTQRTVRRNATRRSQVYHVSRIKRDTYGADWLKICREVKIRDGYRCAGCKDVFIDRPHLLDVHHIIPLTKGGRTTKMNLECRCKLKCHAKKHKHL